MDFISYEIIDWNNFSPDDGWSYIMPTPSRGCGNARARRKCRRAKKQCSSRGAQGQAKAQPAQESEILKWTFQK
jgi:hypothetical protein